MDKKNKNNIAKILLAFGVLASPMMLANQVSADNSIVNTNANNIETNTESNAVTTENVINENKENKKEEKTQPEATATENNKAEATEEATTKENTATDETEATSQTEEKSDENTKVVENKEEVDFKLDASQRHELKEAGYTDEEIQSIENSIKKSLTEDSKFNVYDFVASKVNAKKAEKEPAAENTTAEKETNALGISKEKAPEALQAGDENRAPKDISNEVTNIEGSIEGLINKNATTIKPIAQDPNLEGKDYDTQAEAHVSFDVPNSTIEGDYVDIQLSNNVNINGIVENVQPGQLDAYFGPEKIASASYDKKNRKIRYTFTKDVENYGNVKVNTRFPLFIDKNVVTAPTSKQTIGVKVGDNAPIERTYTVDYHMDNIGGNDKYVSNGYSDITNVNREEGTYDQTIYINPLRKDQRGTKLTIENLPGNSGVIFDQDVLDNVKLYVVKDPGNLALSFAWDPDNLVEVGADGYTKTLDGDKIVLNIKNKVDPLKPNKPDVIRGDSVLVARYEGKFKNDAFDDAATRVTFDNGTPARADNYHWDNIIYTTDADASGTGDEEIGYFEDYHVYQTINADGSITTDDFKFVPQQQGPESKKYETVKIDREGYELVSVESPDGAQFDKDGAKTTGNFVNGKTLHVKYVYQKRPVEKKGSFQEHHIYQTKKLDGSIVQDDKVDKDVTEGTEKENYKTSKEDRDGYKLIEVKSSNGGQFNKDGSEKEAAYIADTKQEVTYIYQKEEVAKKGSFQEHHIYQTKKLDGSIVQDDKVDKDVTEGTEKENYKT
ncbi:Ig-like domain-containing protein, partial [Finegoldia magna]|uniref:Ig-like domain-containing protein n=1 Tax=Finegoldia magna TaxID=1260 RepID=UPI00290F84E0